MMTLRSKPPATPQGLTMSASKYLGSMRRQRLRQAAYCRPRSSNGGEAVALPLCPAVRRPSAERRDRPRTAEPLPVTGLRGSSYWCQETIAAVEARNAVCGMDVAPIERLWAWGAGRL
jgi:hypothetical protein